MYQLLEVSPPFKFLESRETVFPLLKPLEPLALSGFFIPSETPELLELLGPFEGFYEFSPPRSGLSCLSAFTTPLSLEDGE